MRYLKIIILVLLSSCATKSPSEYQLWASKQTPNIWKKNSTWSVVLLDKNGSMVRNLALKFTEESAEDCSSGDFKKIKILSEYPVRGELFMGEAAYKIKGSALIIDLSANLCDAGYELRGQITEIGIEGYHQPVSMFGGEVAGRFYGSPLGNIQKK